MENHNNKKIALVTGAARGIGAAIVKELIKHDYIVLANYFRSRDQALELKEEVAKMGGEVMLYRGDVSSEKSINEFLSEIMLDYGEIDVLINNAGVSSYGLLTDTTEEIWHSVMNTNLTSAYRICRAIVPQMIHRKSGAILNVASVWGIYGASCEVAYSASKAGLIGLTKALARELAPSGIRVNAIAPGVISTNMIKNFNAEEIAALQDKTPLGRLGTPEEVAAAAAFMVSDEASFITGQILGVDGGFIG